MVAQTHLETSVAYLSYFGEHFPRHSTSLQGISRPDVVDMLAQAGHFPVAEQPYKPKEAYLFHCPFHGDEHPSFAVPANRNQWHCWVCGGGGANKLRDMLGGGLTPGIPKASKPPKPAIKRQKDRPAGCTLAQLVEYIGVPIEHLQDLGWYDTKWYGIPTVAIPYPNGIRYRVALTGKDRFRWNEGSIPSLYGADQLLDTDLLVLLEEGESDQAASTFLGIPAVGVPGVGTWKPDWAKDLQGKKVVLWQEPGEAGQNLVDTVARDLPDVRVIRAPSGTKDIVELFHQLGAGAADGLQQLIAEAESCYQEENVWKIVKEDPPYYFPDKPFKPRKRGNLQPSALWDFCCEQFPLPAGRRPKVKGCVWVNQEQGEAVFGDVYATTWFNRVNCAHKQRALLKHTITTFASYDSYCLTVPSDDWDDKRHESIRKSIERAGGKYYAVDNRLSKGYWIYFSTALAPGFQPISDLTALATEAIKGIRVPSEKPTGGFKFRPTRASQEFRVLIDERAADDNKGKLEMVASSKEGIDYTLLEANLREAGRSYELTDPIFRSMPWQCIRVSVNMRDPYRDALDLAVAIGCEPLRKRRQVEEVVEALA